jgi:low molecular weight protein-tyrosine phosphatase
MMMQYISDTYGSKKGFLRHIKTQTLYRLGCYRKYTQLRSDIERIVFVCQGNICRSALAEWVFKDHSNFPVASIGLDTHSGKPANSRMIEIAKSKGVDLSRHKTTSVNDFEPKPRDLYICMEVKQIEGLNSLGLRNAATLLLSTILTKPKITINDPYSANTAYMEKCADDIITSTKALANVYKG